MRYIILALLGFALCACGQYQAKTYNPDSIQNRQLGNPNGG